MVSDADAYRPWVYEMWKDIDVPKLFPDDVRLVFQELEKFITTPKSRELQTHPAVMRLAQVVGSLGAKVEEEWEDSNDPLSDRNIDPVA